MWYGCNLLDLYSVMTCVEVMLSWYTLILKAIVVFDKATLEAGDLCY